MAKKVSTNCWPDLHGKALAPDVVVHTRCFRWTATLFYRKFFVALGLSVGYSTSDRTVDGVDIDATQQFQQAAVVEWHARKRLHEIPSWCMAGFQAQQGSFC